MKACLFYKKLVVIGLMILSAGGISDAMQNQPTRGWFAGLYHRWKTRFDLDFMFYVFPVAQDEQGNFWVLGYEKNEILQPFFMHIEYRPYEPRVFRKSESGKIEYFRGLKYATMGEPIRAYIAEKFIKDKTKDCFKKGAGLIIDDSWYYGRLLGYTKRASYRDFDTNDITVFLKTTYKPLGNCMTDDGQVLTWIPIREESLKQLAKESKLKEWKKLFADYWFSTTISSIKQKEWPAFKFKNYVPGAKEKLWGKPKYFSLERVEPSRV